MICIPWKRISPVLILALVSALTGCDDFVTAHYVPAGFSPSAPVDAGTLVADLMAFGMKNGMKCNTYLDQPQPQFLASCYGGDSRTFGGSYRVIVYAGHPQFEYFTIGPQMFLLYPHFNCERQQAAQKALEEITGPLKPDEDTDYCLGESGDASHG